MLVKMARSRMPIQHPVLWRISSKAEKIWDVLCIALMVACAAYVIGLMAYRGSYEGSFALLLALAGMELIGNQSHRRLCWGFGLQQIWPVLFWMVLTAAAFGATTWFGRDRPFQILALVGVAAVTVVSYRSVRPKCVDLEFAGNGGLSVDGRTVPWNDVQYYISEYAITILERGRKLIAELRLSELPLRETAEIKAQLWERAQAL